MAGIVSVAPPRVGGVAGSKLERSKAVTEALSFVPVELIRLISEYTVSDLRELWEVSILPLLSRRDIFPCDEVLPPRCGKYRFPCAGDLI